MSRNWLRRAVLVAACVTPFLLAACGSGSIESQLTPSRLVVFGDAFADVGQNGTRYTVNDGSVNNWTQKVAVDFGLSLAPVSAGGTSYATAHARVDAKPDAAGNSATPTVSEQVDRFLASDAIGENDLFIVNAGTADLIAEAARVASGGQTTEQMLASAAQEGRDLAAQVLRLVNAGAQHVVVVGPYNVGRSPWGTASGIASTLEAAGGRFNDSMLVELADHGANVLYVDAALRFNLMIANPVAFDMTNSLNLACNSVDPGPGIGIGAGQVNSGLCNPSTIPVGTDYNLHVFADAVYPTPRAHFSFGEYAYSRIRERW